MRDNYNANFVAIMRRDPFQSIADPNRRRIIEVLKTESPITMNALAEKFDISRPAVSKHVKILEKSGVVEIKQVRVERFCYLLPDSLRAVEEWVSSIIEDKKAQTKVAPKPKKSAPKKPTKKVVEKATKKKTSSKAKKPTLSDDEEDQLSLF